jgi:alpha-glucoside transport system permease protein
MDPRLVTALIVVVGVPAVLIGYIVLTEQILRPIPDKRRGSIRPWLWLAPALAFLIVFLVYPTIGTVIRSFQNSAGTAFVGLDNYLWFFQTDEALIALRNNALWLIFLPLAISMVAAAVIWKFMYDFQPAGVAQTGTLNAVIGLFGVGPVGWAITADFSLTTIMLIIVMAWMWTGFAMVILSAGLKGINTELLEAARVDGANEWQVFRGIIFPLLLPTIAVVATTIIITALKTFDIVYTMTNGNYDTEVIANLMYKQMSINPARASALAVVLLLAIIPIMAFNVNRFRAQEAVR